MKKYRIKFYAGSYGISQDLYISSKDKDKTLKNGLMFSLKVYEAVEFESKKEAYEFIANSFNIEAYEQDFKVEEV